MQKALESNIWKYTLLLVTNKRVFVAILGAYQLTIPGVTPASIGLFLVAGSVSGFLFEIPSGYFSDKVGHKIALIISRIAAVASTSFFLIANSIPYLVLGSVFLSLSNAFMTGTGSAFMHETLRGLGRESEYTRVIGKASSIGFAVPVLLVALIPFLVEISFKLPFVIALVIDFVGLGVALSLVKPPVTPDEIEEVKLGSIKRVIQEGLKYRFYRHALFSGMLAGLLLSTGVFRAPYQVALGIPIIWFGVLHGVGRLGASLILAYSGRLQKLIGSIHHFHLYQLVVYAVLFLILGTASLWWTIAIIFILLNGFQWGLTKINEGYVLEMIDGSRFKATLLSFKALIGEGCVAVLGFVMGILIHYTGYSFGFMTVGLGTLTLLALFHFTYLRKS